MRGFPALRYPPFAVEKPRGTTNRVTVIFDGRTEYFVNCQWTSPKRAEINAACDLVLSTITRK